MSDPGKKQASDESNHEGQPGWGGTGYGGSGYGSHEGFGDASYGEPPEAGLDKFEAPPSDESIIEAVSVAIAVEDPTVQASVDNGEVTLTGVVSDPELRRRIEERVYVVRGVSQINNLIRVGYPEDAAPKAWSDEEVTVS